MALGVSAREIEHQVIVDIPFLLGGGSTEDIHRDLDFVALANCINELDKLAKDHSATIKEIIYYSSVSPEGPLETNRQLCRERLLTTKRIIESKLSFPDSIVKYENRFVPWREYLLPAVMANDSLPYREEIIEIISKEPGDGEEDNRRTILKRARGGALWEVVRDNYFEHMRKGGALITVIRVVNEPICHTPIFDDGITLVPVESLSIDTTYVEPVVEEEKEPRHAVSIKTNAASWAALITNLGFEVKLAPRWSIDVMGAYSPYNMFVGNRKIRVFGIRPEVRYWWGEPMKRGHFLGLHGHTAGFNLQVGDKYRYQDPNHALWGVGLAYGYALPLGKKERWGVEFTIGVGYARIKYDKYEGRDNGQFLERKTINYFGPTRLGIDFSYRFDIAGKNKRQKR